VHEQRRVAQELDVGGAERAQRRQPADAQDRDRRAERQRQDERADR
jgi:hypothetical protein